MGKDTTDSTNNKHKMTAQEAGQMGGHATSETHDHEFYENIGREGGKNSPGNFKNDPQRASDAAKNRGQSSKSSDSAAA